VASAAGTQDGGDTFTENRAVQLHLHRESGHRSSWRIAGHAPGPAGGGRPDQRRPGAEIRLGVEVTTATPAHPDYTDTLTFLATGTY
jgi:hypothetical protein